MLKIYNIYETKIDDYGINTMTKLRNYIYTKKPNEKVTLYVMRNNREFTIEVKLGKKWVQQA